MTYEASGTIIYISPTMTFESGFQKREFVLNVSEDQTYPKYPKFEMTKDKVNFLDKYKVGDLVKVKFGLGGNKWDKPDGTIQYFTSLNAFYISGANADLSQPQQNQTSYTPPQQGTYQGEAGYQGQSSNPPSKINDDIEDNLPF